MVERKPKFERLTHLAHELVSQVVTKGDTAVDATAGNGHDTVFLRECVGSTGCVYAVDIQARALHETRIRLERMYEDAAFNVRLIRGCHSSLDELLPDEVSKNVACIMFNLGYLPGADHAVTTLASTTSKALLASLCRLKVGGILTVLVYRDHPGGNEELGVVSDLVRSAEVAGIRWSHYRSNQSSDTAPQLFVALKEPGRAGR